MTSAYRQWGLSNPGPDTLLIWLEPWAEEFNVPERSTIIIKFLGESEQREPDEVEWTEDHLVLWASASTVEVIIDGVPQDSSSAVIPVPGGLTKAMLNIVFAGQPSSRLAGAPNVGERTSWWQRTRRHLTL